MSHKTPSQFTVSEEVKREKSPLTCHVACQIMDVLQQEKERKRKRVIRNEERGKKDNNRKRQEEQETNEKKMRKLG